MNTSATTLILFALLGYAFGSLPFAVIVSRAMGLADPRSFGSGNPGATNVLRSGSKKAAILTLLGDALKGWLAMLIAQALGADALALGIVGLTAFLGHVFPVTLGFKGGKGVATALGVLGGFHWALALIAAGVWLLVALSTRLSSLAALVAAITAPLAALLVTHSDAVTVPVTIMSAILLWRHKDNIKRLLNGSESRIGSKKK